MAGFFSPGIEPIICIRSITWLNLAARLVAEPVHGPSPVDAWTVVRVSHALDRGPWPAILDPVALVAALPGARLAYLAR